LRGVSEAIVCRTNEQIIDESSLKQLWHNNQPPTVDSWVKNFRWSIKLSALDLESHVHNNLAQLVKNKDVASHIVSPASGVFGEILAMSITKRGLGGTAIVLNIKTSKGDWKIKKELNIRNLFKNGNGGLKRLSSAKIFLDQIRDTQNKLIALHIYGLGSGHGVGLQQVGAEGLARLNKTFIDIINHYYTDIEIQKV
jgi:SpoIID/LytB domain protein